MYPNEIAVVDEIFAYLSQVTASPARQPAKSLTHVHVEAIIQILDRWPSSQRFPSKLYETNISQLIPDHFILVIDLSRLLIGFCPDAFIAPGLQAKFTDALFNASEWSAPWTSHLSKARETNMLLLLRTIANAFQEEGGTNAEWLARVSQVLILNCHVLF